MSLEKYNQKRDPKITTEPFGGKTSGDDLRFVVQKHAASHLHYDFRLEMDNVLKSWAVPKGPSLDPDIKRLAMMVEDHPYDYRTFEGIIPQGEYGGGTVMVWDEGTYLPADFEGNGKNEMQKQLLDQLEHGKIKFILEGKKLKGEFALIKAHGRGENGWLLMKLKDSHSSKDDILDKDKSVVSKKTLEQIATTSTNILGEKKAEGKKTASTEKKSKAKPKSITDKKSSSSAELLKSAAKTKFPVDIEPMLATLVSDPFNDPDWTYEVKWDGYRCIASVNKGKASLKSRNSKSFSEKYYPIVAALEKWNTNAVLDGEIVVLKKDGTSDFSALQNWRSEADGTLAYYVFDLLWYNGKNCMDLPLEQRQSILQEILPEADDFIRPSKVFKVNGIDFFEAAKKMQLEGIMAKKTSSKYYEGKRSKDWLKVKVDLRQEVVIAGFTKNEDSSKLFSSLLLGVYENGSLQYVGKVGTGFNAKSQKAMMEEFKPFVTKEIPFNSEPDVNKPSRFRPNPPRAKATWLKPELVCEVSYTEVTNDGVFRHPSFKGMRSDKKAQDVIREEAENTEKAVELAENDATAVPHHKIIDAPHFKERSSLLNPTEQTQVKKINNNDLKFTNLSKVFWPEQGYTKRDMFNYYYLVAEYIVPHLKHRPMSLNRYPGGINGKSFYQKDVKGKAPSWALTYPYQTSDGEDKEFLVGDDEDTLLWMASLGCIEMNPWFSTIEKPDNPDYCVIDLDPDQNTFEQVIIAAQEVKKVLDEMKIACYPKTSGSTGIHIYIPLGAKYTYDQSQMFAKLIVSIVNKKLKEFTSLERLIKNRGGKMYLDYLQNRPGATIASVYSLRPKVGATVSMPLYWEEVKSGLKMGNFTIKNSVERIRKEGDIFLPTLGDGFEMASALKSAQEMLENL